ncbi:hypothetical protein Q5P01_003090 [Channa striata]|uniref:Uncharacterized protein n=1 Tax=Channa striata TaxID=64152 RepID=A0AA88NNU9_CHASR|nr:hypothetical protein Q5P01_003090 [Channa striata]
MIQENQVRDSTHHDQDESDMKEERRGPDLIDLNEDQAADRVQYTSDIKEEDQDSDFIDQDHHEDDMKKKNRDKDHGRSRINGNQGSIFTSHDHLYSRMKEEKNQDPDHVDRSEVSVQEQIQDLDSRSSDPAGLSDHQLDDTTLSCPSEPLYEDISDDELLKCSTPVPLSSSSSTFSVADWSASDGHDERFFRAEATPGAAFSPPAKKRRGTAGGPDTVQALRFEQMTNCVALMSHLNATFRRHDEFTTFGLAIADSLRKLPAERVEAAKCKVFAVLGEAHAR